MTKVCSLIKNIVLYSVLSAVREALALSEQVPILRVDARSRESAKAALIAVTEYALSRLPAAAG